MRARVGVVVFISFLIAMGAKAEAPMPVSPGSRAGVAVVSGTCPTFHWTAVAEESVELVVYRVPREEAGDPPELVLTVSLPGAASGWTPSLTQCLEAGGRYAWSVRAGGAWSEASLFEVNSGPSMEELEEALTVVRRYLAEEVPAEAQAQPPVAAETLVPLGGGEAAGATDPPSSAPVSDSAVLPVGELDCRAGRYEDNGDGTVTDCRTGLVWLEDGSCDSLGPNGNGKATWQEAHDTAAALSSGTCGLTDASTAGDWRLATRTEWMAVIASALRQGFSDPALTDARGSSKWTTDGDAFVGVQSTIYWTATEWIGPTDAWYVHLFGGDFNHAGKLTDILVWPVRDGQ